MEKKCDGKTLEQMISDIVLAAWISGVDPLDLGFNQNQREIVGVALNKLQSLDITSAWNFCIQSLQRNENS